MINTSILKKVVMALTGLAWFGFLITHLLANLQIYQGAETFNAYPEKLRQFGFLLWVAEAGLVVFLFAHVWSGIKAVIENRKARNTRYAVRSTFGSATFASRTMPIGGLILLIFIVLHVYTFKFGDWDRPNGLWGLVVETFKNPLVVAWYVLGCIALGLHLSHGLGSSLQTLGVSRPLWRIRLKRAGFILGWLMAGGFMALPIWSFLVPASQ